MKKKLLISLFILLITLLSLSYGTLIYSSPTSKATSLIIGDLTYGIDVTASNARVSGKTVNVSPNTTSIVNLKVTSLNEVDTKYGIDYKILSGTGTVKYASNTGWLPTGKLSKTNYGTYEKLVKIVINATSDMSVDFTISGGYSENELTETKEGYTRLTEKSDNITSYNDTLTNVTEKEANNNIYGGESLNNYLKYPVNDDNTKNIWRIIGYYNRIGTKIISNKTSSTTKTTLQTDLTNFYNTLEMQDRFILNTDKFNCTTSSCTSSSYSKIGLISVNEYNELGGVNSYLASTDNFFALDDNTIKSITPTGIEESETRGLKPTIYLQDYVTVTGTGTVGDPFKLKLPEYTVTVNVVNGSTTLPGKMITRGEDATYTLTPNTGYKNVIQSDTCKGTYSGNTYTISGVTENKNCTITFAPETYTLTLDVNGGNALSTNTKTITYNSTYGELPTPTRTGYTFNGWKGKNLYSDLYNIEFGGLSYSNGTFKQTSDDGTTHSFELQGFKDSAYVKNVAYTYDISIGKKTFSFTADGTYNGLRLKINGGKQDNYVLFNAPFLENGKTYTLSFQVINSTAGSISWNNLQIEEGSKATVYEPMYVTSSTKVTLTSNHTLKASWTANEYTLTFNPNGGSVSTISKTVTFGSTYGELPTPTRTGYTFKGWHNQLLYSASFSLTALAGNWNHNSVIYNLNPGETYNISIDNAKVTSGSATQFTTVIYDFSLNQSISPSTQNNFGSNINYSVGSSASATKSDDIRLLIYSGVAGSTSNIATSFTGVNIYSTNKITKTTYTSVSKVETPYNHQLLAEWSINSYAFKLTKGTGISMIYYKINGSSSYTSSTSNVSTTATFGTTYSYYAVASTGYTISTCTQSSPCSGTIGTSGVNATLSATLNKYNVTLSVTNGSGSTTKSVSHGSSVSFTVTPSSGYKAEIDTNSCGGTLSGSTYTVSNITSARTCNISFKKDIPTLYAKLLADKTSRSVTTRPNGFSGVYTSDNIKTLYTSTENGTTVYYFAGNALDNWVKFGGFYWRIIRTNADGGIRLLYHGKSHDSISECSYTSQSAFNNSGIAPKYMGYMYDSNGTNSSIKNAIDTWYVSNLTNYTKYLSTTAVYCNDRTNREDDDFIRFGASDRINYSNNTPTYNCTNTSDAFSVSNTNAKLTYPIGLMTADEVIFASDGLAYHSKNSQGLYINNCAGWYTMSPEDWLGSYSRVFFVRGSTNPGSLQELDIRSVSGVRPVTSLKSCVKWKSGDGSATNPYEIVETTSGC